MDSVGNCDTNFLALSARVARNLMAISDVMYEMGIIRKVNGHQAGIWRDMHGINPGKPKSTSLVFECNCKSTQGVLEVIDRSRDEIDKIIGDARRVNKRVSPP